MGRTVRPRKKGLIALAILAATVLTGCYARPVMPDSSTGVQVGSTFAVLATDPASVSANPGDSGYWYWRLAQVNTTQLDGIHSTPSLGPWQKVPVCSTCSGQYNTIYSVNQGVGLNVTKTVYQLQPGTYYYPQLCATNQNTTGGWSGVLCVDGKGQAMNESVSGQAALDIAMKGGGGAGQTNNGDDDGTPADMFRTIPWASCADNYGQRVVPASNNIDLNNDGYCEPPGQTALGSTFYVGFDDSNTSGVDERVHCYISRGSSDGSVAGFTSCQQNWQDPGTGLVDIPPVIQGDQIPGIYYAKTQAYGNGACATGVARYEADAKIWPHPRMFTVKMNQKICLTGGGFYNAATKPQIQIDISLLGESLGWKWNCPGVDDACGGKYKITGTLPGGGQTSFTKRIVDFRYCPTISGHLECIQDARFPMKNYWTGVPGFIGVTSVPSN